MKLITVFFTLCAFPLAGYCQSPDGDLYAQVENAIKKEDASLLNRSDYEEIETKISNGDNKFISLYPKLTAEPFLGAAAFQEGIDTALSLALPVNSGAVLRQITPNNINTVCAMPFTEPSRNALYNYYYRTRTELTRAGEAGAACLAVLNGQMVGIQKEEAAGEMEWGGE